MTVVSPSAVDAVAASATVVESTFVVVAVYNKNEDHSITMVLDTRV